jgi:prepilin-type N-terminal cleavage/methylation domain-containing protein
MKVKTVKTKGGFTLIELLIVIGLLGALTALILPRLAADHEEAMGDVCDYNQAGTVRVLTQRALLPRPSASQPAPPGVRRRGWHARHGGRRPQS